MTCSGDEEEKKEEDPIVEADPKELEDHELRHKKIDEILDYAGDKSKEG